MLLQIGWSFLINDRTTARRSSADDLHMGLTPTYSDEAEPAYDREVLQAALAAHPDFDERAARRVARDPTSWTADRDAVLIDRNGSLYLYRFSTDELRKFTSDTEPRRLVDLSPNGDAVGFVRGNNLYMIDTRTGKQRQITRDGSDTLLNGVLDWVYQEEIYGRGRWRASWWRADAEYLAYFQLDQSDVPVYSLVDYMPLYSATEQTRYPKAGEPNPEIRLGIARSRTGRTVWVDLSVFPADLSKVRVGQSVRIVNRDPSITGEGKITTILPVGSSTNQTTTARVLLDNPDHRWVPGHFVTAEVVLSETEVPTAIRDEAIQIVEDQTVVFVEGDEGFEARPVTLGRSDGQVSEVLSGLQAGEAYVSTNSFTLKSELGKEDAEHGH